MAHVLALPAPQRPVAEARLPIGYTIIGACLVSGMMWVGLIAGVASLVA